MKEEGVNLEQTETEKDSLLRKLLVVGSTSGVLKDSLPSAMDMLSEKGKRLIVMEEAKFRFGKVLASGQTLWRCTNKSCKAKLYTLDNNEIVNSDLNHNHQLCKNLQRAIINNSVKKKAKDDLTEPPTKLINLELKENQGILPTFTTKDVHCVRKNISYARRSTLPPIPKNRKDVQEALNSIAMTTAKGLSSSKNELKYYQNSGLGFESNRKKLFNCENNILEDYICEHCSFTTDLRIALRYHVKNTHINSQKTWDYEAKNYICLEWDFRTYSALLWLKHGFNCYWPHYETGQITKCPYCSFETKKSIRLKNHIISLHTASEKIKWYECDQCNYKGRLPVYLKRHLLAKHTPENQVNVFTCDLCQFKTKQRKYLKKHIRNKHVPRDVVKRYKCDHCEYKALNKWNLNQHINNKHTPENKKEDKKLLYKCNNCYYESPVKERLKVHIDIKHTPKEHQKWYKCDYCEHKTLTKGNLKSHVNNRHTSEDKVKWFNCDYCDYKSKQSRGLKNHVIVRHTAPEDTVWFKCEYCKFKTRFEHSFKSHHFERHSDKAYVGQ